MLKQKVKKKQKRAVALEETELAEIKQEHEDSKTHKKRFKVSPEKFFRTKSGLLMIKNWSRDGITIDEMAKRAELPYNTMYKIIKENKKCLQAFYKGKEYVDYKVENALLKSALGFKSKTVEIITEFRGGACVGKFVKETEIENPPNVQAATFWLTNRTPEKWKKDRDKTDALINVKDNEMKISIVQASAEEMKEAEKNQYEGLGQDDDDIIDGEYNEVEQNEIEDEEE